MPPLCHGSSFSLNYVKEGPGRCWDSIFAPGTANRVDGLNQSERVKWYEY